ncbi:MAG: hypothetical protein WCA97_01185 [Terriglobales bacterium]|jgi:hypothetical protein
MRILYISNGQSPDYLSDMLFHGLRSELGLDVVDLERVWYMYAAEFGEGRHDKSKLYGRGFTMFGLLGDDLAVDRTDILQKIRSKYFDLVIYGSIQRCAAFLEDVLTHYPAEQIVFVDGEDHTNIVPVLLGRGIYFKRELAAPDPRLRPIQFAIPEERIATVSRQKSKVQAFIDPRDTRTYIYKDESAYYGDYAESLFAVTIKKAGWDCLRHYEIMANRCIPHFIDLDSCPRTTLMFLPKYELRVASNLLTSQGPAFFCTREGLDNWSALHQRIDLAFRRHCTTRALARYVIETASILAQRSHPSLCPPPSLMARASTACK